MLFFSSSYRDEQNGFSGLEKWYWCQYQHSANWYFPAARGQKLWADRFVSLYSTPVFCCSFIGSMLVRSRSIVFVSWLTGQRCDIPRLPSYFTIFREIGYWFHETTSPQRASELCDKSLWSPASEYAPTHARSSMSLSGFVKTVANLTEYREVWGYSRNISSLAYKPREENDRLASY